MRKIVTKALCVICIIATLFLTFYPNWIIQNGLKSKELKAYKQEITDGLTVAKESLLDSAIIKSDAFKEAGLNITKTGIKRLASVVKDIVNMVFDGKLTPFEFAKISAYSVKLVNVAGKLGSVKETEALLNTAKLFYYSMFNYVYENYSGYFSCIYICLIEPLLMVLIAIFGILYVIEILTNKKKVFGVLFIVSELLLVIILVGIQILSNMYMPVLELKNEISLSITFAPIVCAVLCFMPLVIQKTVNKGENKNG